MPALIISKRSQEILAENPFPSLWIEIADELTRRLHVRNSQEIDDPEWMLLNALLMSGYFWTCKIPEARLVRSIVFKDVMKKPLAVRGLFLRIPELISTSGIEDLPIPKSSLSSVATLHHYSFTQALSTTIDEYQRVASGSGFLHKLLSQETNLVVPETRQGLVTVSQLIRARDEAYLLYEHTILSYLSLACIEQLMRTWATNSSVNHLNASGRPIGVMKWLRDLNPSSTLTAALSEIYDPDKSNIRNRVMHGNLFEIEGKSLDTRLPIAAPHRFGKSINDAYLPENISSICFSVLQLVDNEIASKTNLQQPDMSWINFFSLSKNEIDFGNQLKVDVLSDDGPEWVEYISRYLNAVMPALKQPFSIGVIGWLKTLVENSLPCFMALGLVFESIYRMTVHLFGFSILQTSKPNGANILKYQYRMLDETALGLSREKILDEIVSHVPPCDRDTAIRTLRLAIKARNALSHGAIPNMDQRTTDAIGHFFFKSVQTLVSAGLHHMSNQAAYFEWLNSPELQREECWYRGEREVFSLIRKASEF